MIITIFLFQNVFNFFYYGSSRADPDSDRRWVKLDPIRDPLCSPRRNSYRLPKIESLNGRPV